MISPLLSLLRHGNQLKRTPRTGWLIRGVPNAESVADHTFGVAFMALIIRPYIADELDLARLLSLALIHDLPEAVTTDVPAPVWRRMPGEHKPALEGAILEEMIAAHADRPFLESLWAELQADETVEARLIHELDKLEMMLQADQYEKQTGSRLLAEFWQKERRFTFPIIQQLYITLREERK